MCTCNDVLQPSSPQSSVSHKSVAYATPQSRGSVKHPTYHVLPVSALSLNLFPSPHTVLHSRTHLPYPYDLHRSFQGQHCLSVHAFHSEEVKGCKVQNLWTPSQLPLRQPSRPKGLQNPSPCQGTRRQVCDSTLQIPRGHGCT